MMVVRSTRVVTPTGVRAASIHVYGATIARVAEWGDAPPNVIDVGDDVIMPGLVATHVHVNDPGRAEWEGFETATRAAAAGGVTTIVEMPLNSIPPTTTLENFQKKLAAAEGKCTVDVGFWGGVVPGNSKELAPLFNAGVRGFKCFLVHSGVDEFPNVTEADLREAMPELARLGATLIVHAELPGPIEIAGRQLSNAGANAKRVYETFLHARPRVA